VAGRRVLSGLDVTPASDRVTAERERLKGGPVNWGQRAVLSSHVARIKRLRSLTLPPEQPSDGGRRSLRGERRPLFERGRQWPDYVGVGIDQLSRRIERRVLILAAIACGSSSPSLSARLRSGAGLGESELRLRSVRLQLSCWTWASRLAELPVPRVTEGRFPGTDRVHC
jgi:hypothetical protein